MLGLIDHIGVATRDIDHAIEILRKTGGIEVGRRGSVSAFQVEMVMVAAGGAPIELIQPTSPESPVAAFMEKRGEGVHHVAYRVDDLEAALRECRNQGLNLIDEDLFVRGLEDAQGKLRDSALKTDDEGETNRLYGVAFDRFG
ncbi:VOC family protein [Candidatus Sumerlaeota bacterium]|nr:VOC family protein [Candidatus Sumerlaeota bacterium]